MNDQAIRFRLGIFVLASLILLAVLITMFGGFPNYFKRSDLYNLEFANAQGVSPGTPVRRSGVRIGEVRKVSLDNATGKVNVVIQVEDGYSLRRSDRPMLQQGLLAGDTSIAFIPPDDPKKDDPTPIPVGETIAGYTALDAGALLQKTSDLVPPAQDAMVEMKKVFQKIDKLIPSIDDAAKELANLAKGVREVGPELRKTNSQIQSLTKKAEDALDVANPAIRDFQELAKEAQKALKRVDPTLEEYQALAKDARTALMKVDPTIDEIRKASLAFQDVSKDVKKITTQAEPLVEETRSALRQWASVGERVNVMLRTNEDKINKILVGAEDSLRRLGEFMSDENQKNVQAILRNTRRSSDRFEGITIQVEDLLRSGQGSLKRIETTLTKAESFFDNLQSVSKPFGEKAPAILKNLDEATLTLNRTLTDLREILQAVARGEGTVQKLLTDPSLFNNINDTAEMASKIMPRLDRILRDVETFADKIARHPESLGISGVVRPSTGLKENSVYPTWRLVPQH